MTPEDYTRMQKAHYEASLDADDKIVGNYAWHENFPYETLLLHEDGDIRKPIFPTTQNLRALDFACGPGRMVTRMSRFFGKVDGVDLSQNLIDLAKQRCPGSEFWVTQGNDLGEAPRGAYDFIYSTIALQHIAVHSIREKIFRSMKQSLRPGGKVTLQMGYSDTYPYRRTTYRVDVGPVRANLLRRMGAHASWKEDKTNAEETNGACDVVITPDDLPIIEQEFSAIFGSCKIWLYEVGSRFSPPFGPNHSRFWSTHWIFLHAVT